jgi:hypothetical protein
MSFILGLIPGLLSALIYGLSNSVHKAKADIWLYGNVYKVLGGE